MPWWTDKNVWQEMSLPSWGRRRLLQRPWWPTAAPDRWAAPAWRRGPSTAARSAGKSDQAGAWRACQTAWYGQRTRDKRKADRSVRAMVRCTWKRWDRRGAIKKGEIHYVFKREETHLKGFKEPALSSKVWNYKGQAHHYYQPMTAWLSRIKVCDVIFKGQQIRVLLECLLVTRHPCRGRLHTGLA